MKVGVMNDRWYECNMQDIASFIEGIIDSFCLFFFYRQIYFYKNKRDVLFDFHNFPFSWRAFMTMLSSISPYWHLSFGIHIQKA
jgi:hypothetical protein